MRIKKIVSVLILVLSVLLLVGCDFGKLLESKTRTTVTESPTTVVTTTKENVTTTTTEAVTTTEKVTTQAPVTTTEKVTTAPVVTTTAPITSVTIWQTTTTANYSSVWTTPLTDKLSLDNISDYYKTFDYNCITTYSGVDLITYVQSFIKKMPYMASQSYGSIRYDYYRSDASLTDSSKVVLFYCQEEIAAKWDGNKWNREHVFCQSTGGFGTNVDVGYDLHHVRPTDAVVNSTRNNNPYGTVSVHNSSTEVHARYTPNQSLAGWLKDGVFEPLDSVKGDVARICFYVSVCYYMRYSNIELSKIVSDKTLKTILEWNKLDPVDALEAQRNNVAYELQGNRNIFIDYPELADVIWG